MIMSPQGNKHTFSLELYDHLKQTQLPKNRNKFDVMLKIHNSKCEMRQMINKTNQFLADYMRDEPLLESRYEKKKTLVSPSIKISSNTGFGLRPDFLKPAIVTYKSQNNITKDNNEHNQIKKHKLFKNKHHKALSQLSGMTYFPTVTNTGSKLYTSWKSSEKKNDMSSSLNTQVSPIKVKGITPLFKNQKLFNYLKTQTHKDENEPSKKEDNKTEYLLSSPDISSKQSYKNLPILQDVQSPFYMTNTNSVIYDRMNKTRYISPTDNASSFKKIYDQCAKQINQGETLDSLLDSYSKTKPLKSSIKIINRNLRLFRSEEERDNDIIKEHMTNEIITDDNALSLENLTKISQNVVSNIRKENPSNMSHKYELIPETPVEIIKRKRYEKEKKLSKKNALMTQKKIEKLLDLAIQNKNSLLMKVAQEEYRQEEELLERERTRAEQEQKALNLKNKKLMFSYKIKK